jgi:RND family efflux transporter MFP subunit
MMLSNFRLPGYGIVVVLAALTLVTQRDAMAGPIEGFAEPFRRIEVAAGAPGMVASVLLKPSQRVRKNDLLATLDTTVLETSLAVARLKAQSTGGLDVARAELELQSEQVQQIRDLRGWGHSTQRELARAETDFELAKAQIKLAEEAAALRQLECRRIEAQIELHRIRSPIDGVVAEVFIEVGEAVSGIDLRIVTLVQLDQLRVRFAVTPAQVAQVRAGQTIEIVLPDLKRRVEGTVDRISALIDAKSGTLEMNVVVHNVDEALRSGTRCLLDFDTALITER